MDLKYILRYLGLKLTCFLTESSNGFPLCLAGFAKGPFVAYNALAFSTIYLVVLNTSAILHVFQLLGQMVRH